MQRKNEPQKHNLIKFKALKQARFLNILITLGKKDVSHEKSSLQHIVFNTYRMWRGHKQ
jgi:hypothetical protein